MRKENKNIPAFPVSTANPDLCHQDGMNTFQFPGMSLMDYFAAKILPEIYKANDVNGHGLDPEEIARDAYLFANAMLSARGR